MLHPKQKQKLKGQAHALKPVVLIGKKGDSENLRKEIEQALTAHELIKIKFLESAFENEESLTSSLCEILQAELVEHRGHVVTMYRKNPEQE